MCKSVCDANYCLALLLFCLDTPLLDCLYHIFNILFVILCLHTNKRRPCSSTLSGHPLSSFLFFEMDICVVSMLDFWALDETMRALWVVQEHNRVGTGH